MLGVLILRINRKENIFMMKMLTTHPHYTYFSKKMCWFSVLMERQGGSVNDHTGRKPCVNWYGGGNIAYFCDILWSNVAKYIYLAMLWRTAVYVRSMGDFEKIVKWHVVHLRGGCRPFKDSLSHSVGLLRVTVGYFRRCLGLLLAK